MKLVKSYQSTSIHAVEIRKGISKEYGWKRETYMILFYHAATCTGVVLEGGIETFRGASMSRGSVKLRQPESGEADKLDEIVARHGSYRSSPDTYCWDDVKKYRFTLSSTQYKAFMEICDNLPLLMEGNRKRVLEGLPTYDHRKILGILLTGSEQEQSGHPVMIGFSN